MLEKLAIEIQQVPQTQDREVFHRQLTHANEEGSLDKDLSFKTFNDYFSGIGYSPDVILSGFFHLKKEQFRGYETGNAVNYLAKVSEGLEREKLFNDGSSEKNYRETIDNLLSLVAEYPLAETTKIETRTFEWEADNEGWHMKTVAGHMDEILSDAISSSQSEDFEKPRFEANQANYDKLRKARAGDKRIFVEFSPSPAASNEATARGYLGNDAIFFYSLDENGQEVVTQRWLKTDDWDHKWEKFGSLLKSLGKDVDGPLSDANIMRASDFFNDQQIGEIANFISRNNGLLSDKREVIDAYVKNDLRTFIEREVEYTLITGADDLIKGKDISKSCEDLIESLTYAQARFRVKLSELTGLNTLPARMSTHYQETVREINVQDFERMDTDRDLRAQFMRDNQEKLKLAGCGTNIGEKDSIFGGSSSGGTGAFGRAGGFGSLALLANRDGFVQEDKYGSLEFECPSCGQTNVRQKGELKTHCDHCAVEIAKC